MMKHVGIKCVLIIENILLSDPMKRYEVKNNVKQNFYFR